MTTDSLLPALTLSVAIERFPTAGTFTIARGSRTEAVVVTATVTDGKVSGRGECVPYTRYGETVDGVAEAIAAQSTKLGQGGSTSGLIAGLKPGAARNAIDCAIWDYRCKAAGRRIWDVLGRPPPPELVTCYTLSLGTPETMQAAAETASHRPLLKVKLGGEGDAARIAAVRRGAPNARLVVDANEAWRPDNLADHAAACADAGVEVIEQPLPAAEDAPLDGFASPVRLCADESVHARESLTAVAKRYGAINIKLDKTGGLTEALAMAEAAKALGLGIMAGCMVGTSLAMAPAVMIGAMADFVDLDGPLLLAKDREPGIRYEGSKIVGFDATLWG